MADASCSAATSLSAPIPLIYGTATKVPHLSRFTSHPRYSVAVLLTTPLTSTTSKENRTYLFLCADARIFRLTRPAWGEPGEQLEPGKVYPIFQLTRPFVVFKCAQYHFNSLAPHGANRFIFVFLRDPEVFQLTRPAWGEPESKAKIQALLADFNSLAPRGANPGCAAWAGIPKSYFNSLASRGANPPLRSPCPWC